MRRSARSQHARAWLRRSTRRNARALEVLQRLYEDLIALERLEASLIRAARAQAVPCAASTCGAASAAARAS